LTKTDIELFKKLSLSMYRKDLLGIFHGSISIKKSEDSFLINKKDAIFDEIDEDSLVDISISKHILWNIASLHTPVHSAIYETIGSAKFVFCLYPPYTVAYSLNNKTITPKDLAGKTHLKNINIYDPGNLSDWLQRSPSEVSLYMKEKNITSMVVKGVGIYSYNRNIKTLIEEVAMIDMSCRILLLDKNQQTQSPIRIH